MNIEDEIQNDFPGCFCGIVIGGVLLGVAILSSVERKTMRVSAFLSSLTIFALMVASTKPHLPVPPGRSGNPAARPTDGSRGPRWVPRTRTHR